MHGTVRGPHRLRVQTRVIAIDAGEPASRLISAIASGCPTWVDVITDPRPPDAMQVEDRFIAERYRTLDGPAVGDNIGDTSHRTRRFVSVRWAPPVSRDFNLEAAELSSAAPGRLHSASPVTSSDVGFEARRCTMVVNPRHYWNAGRRVSCMRHGRLIGGFAFRRVC
jgi:hypothetical protein